MFGITRAPDLDRPGLVWFNTPGPLSLVDLRGRIVILDFWTSCCVNCMHVLPTLRLIEETFPDEVAVIGVHSPKFAAEREALNVGLAVARHGIRHPVVHDPLLSIWEDYAVRSWPTLVFLSPDGQVIGQVSGEPSPDALVAGIAHMITQFRQDGSLDPGVLPLTSSSPMGYSLRFPGKIKPCPGPSPLWAVADAGHHQIVLFNDGGEEVLRYGSGQPGLEDGAAQASFRDPQGLACDNDAIWVADTGNHALRRIDRASGLVSTVAGTGLRGAALGSGAVDGQGTALASPWDVEIVDGQIFFANAGTHQIGVYDPATARVWLAAGTGGEALGDGPAQQALLAQPSGLALGEDGLYFADSETSAVRRLTLGASPQVETLVGQGLFQFGHDNGPLAEATLQHPLAVAVVDGAVLVVDSYNDCLRRLDLDKGVVEDLDLGDCADEVCLPLGQPAGLTAAGPGRLLLSDANNHRIVEIFTDLGQYRTWAV